MALTQCFHLFDELFSSPRRTRSEFQAHLVTIFLTFREQAGAVDARSLFCGAIHGRFSTYTLYSYMCCLNM